MFVNLSLKIEFASRVALVIRRAVRYLKFHKFDELLPVVRDLLLPVNHKVLLLKCVSPPGISIN